MNDANPAPPADPYNVIITGVGGQGNVMASRLLGKVLTRNGMRVTIGETFGVSQRGGSVMSHLRVSRDTTWSPQIPKGRAHLIVALEPSEAIRVLAEYGNPGVLVVCNIRPLPPMGVISGQATYPSPEEVREGIGELSARSWFLDATAEAVRLGSPIYGNIVMLGAAAATGALPVERDDFQAALAANVPAGKVDRNMEAFDAGMAMVG